MAERNVRRTTRQLTPQQRARLRRQQRQIAAELPDLIAQDGMRKEAREEPTLSGELRRAVHASDLPLDDIAARAGITALVLDEFLTAERTLRSDTLDRLANAVGFLQSAHR